MSDFIEDFLNLETDKPRSKKSESYWRKETEEERERRFEENRRRSEESRKRNRELFSSSLKSSIPEEGIHTYDSEGNSSFTYRSYDGSDTIVTETTDKDGKYN